MNQPSLYQEWRRAWKRRRFQRSGMKPWTKGYVEYKSHEIACALREGDFRKDLLPPGCGFRLDERIVEYPWLFSRLPAGPGLLLDAGSVLNFDFVLEHPALQNKKVHICTIFFTRLKAGGVPPPRRRQMRLCLIFIMRMGMTLTLPRARALFAVWNCTRRPMSHLVEFTSGPALTFILPTRNRRNHVERAVESCLRVHQGGVRVELLVIDGNSTDGSYEALEQRYGQDPRVRLRRQTGPKGFMPACFLAVPLVRTPLVTFMYDDDVLSPFWGEMPREMQRRGADFVMGFSKEEEIETEAAFERVANLRVVTPPFLLRAFCGAGSELSKHALPFSPICCLMRTDRLREWMEQVEQFTRGRPLREYFMMQRNAGPDLMLYFHAIASHQAEIPVFDGPVAQFSAHVNSITSGLAPTDLPIGYWLARVWLCDRLRELNRPEEAGWCAAYTLKQGLRLAFKRIRRRHWPWLGAFLGEILSLNARTLAGASASSFLKHFPLLLLPRRVRPQSGLSIRTERLLS
jgi:hypothetical protein